MSAASLALWTILAGGDVTDRESLPAGLHPAGVLLAEAYFRPFQLSRRYPIDATCFHLGIEHTVVY